MCRKRKPTKLDGRMTNEWKSSWQNIDTSVPASPSSGCAGAATTSKTPGGGPAEFGQGQRTRGPPLSTVQQGLATAQVLTRTFFPASTSTFQKRKYVSPKIIFIKDPKRLRSSVGFLQTIRSETGRLHWLVGWVWGSQLVKADIQKDLGRLKTWKITKTCDGEWANREATLITCTGMSLMLVVHLLRGNYIIASIATVQVLDYTNILCSQHD